MSQFAVLAVLLPTTLLGVLANAQTRDDLATAARAFDEGALRRDDDNAKATPIRKRTGPIHLAFRNSGRAPGLVEPTRRAVRRIAVEAAVIVEDVAADDPSADFIVSFDENESPSGKRNCLAQTWWKAWSIYRNELKINPAYAGGIDGCIIHESMHAFGFNSHPHGGDSVLSYVYKRSALTPLDIHLIHTLYDPRMTIGLKPAAASQLGCRILGERMESSATDVAAVCTDRKGPMPSN